MWRPAFGKIMMSSYTRPAPIPARELAWALAGLLLALVLLGLLVSVLNDNVAQAQSSREVAEVRMQERGRCNVLRKRLEREQCLLELRMNDPAQSQSQLQTQLQGQR